jgi:hypothetical protein
MTRAIHKFSAAKVAALVKAGYPKKEPRNG